MRIVCLCYNGNVPRPFLVVLFGFYINCLDMKDHWSQKRSLELLLSAEINQKKEKRQWSV